MKTLSELIILTIHWASFYELKWMFCPLLTVMSLIHADRDFPAGTVDENTLSNAVNMGSIPGLGRLYLLQSN